MAAKKKGTAAASKKRLARLKETGYPAAGNRRIEDAYKRFSNVPYTSTKRRDTLASRPDNPPNLKLAEHHMKAIRKRKKKGS